MAKGGRRFLLRGKPTCVEVGEKLFKLRSMLEADWLRALYSSPSVDVVLYEDLAIVYTTGRMRRLYYPDFLVRLKNGQEVVLEVKPSEAKKTFLRGPKRKAAVAFCTMTKRSFLVVTEKDLPKIGDCRSLIGRTLGALEGGGERVAEDRVVSTAEESAQSGVVGGIGRNCKG